MGHELARAAMRACCAASLLATAAAQTADRRAWTLSGLEEKAPEFVHLGYGAPESDDSLGAFRCKPGSGVVTLFVSETGERLKPGGKATATLSAGEIRTRVAGRLLPNEEAGVPSFEGRIGADNPIFEAMAGGETLTVAVGPSKQTAPLRGASEKFRKFAAACAGR